MLVALVGGSAWWHVRRYERKVKENYKSFQTAGESGEMQLKSVSLQGQSMSVIEVARGQPNERPWREVSKA